MANSSKVLRAASTLSTSENGTEQTNSYDRGVLLNIVTADKASSASLTVKLQWKDTAGNWIDITGAVTAAITTNTSTQLIMYPGVTASANAAVSHPLPRKWRAVYTISGGTFTLSVNAEKLI